MNKYYSLLLAGSITIFQGWAAEHLLEHLVLPKEVSNTLKGLAKGKQEFPHIMVQLPKGYDAKKSYPLFVWVPGGAGGIGDNPGGARSLIQSDQYFYMTLPLFQKQFNKKGPYGGMLVLKEDLDVISANFGTIMKAFLKKYPNIDSTRSGIGGFSNGAHSISFLLDANDDFCKHFNTFLLADGGFRMEGIKALKGKQLLMIFGEGKNERSRKKREKVLKNANALVAKAKGTGAYVELKIMKGVGHSFPKKEKVFFRSWFNNHQPARDLKTTEKKEMKREIVEP